MGSTQEKSVQEKRKQYVLSKIRDNREVLLEVERLINAGKDTEAWEKFEEFKPMYGDLFVSLDPYPNGEFLGEEHKKRQAPCS